jgi:hypothetical protein
MLLSLTSSSKAPILLDRKVQVSVARLNICKHPKP